MYKILIVDDENLVRVAFRTMVDYETFGFTVCATACNGVEALEMCDLHQPDLVITDIKMPRMDGIELIEQLRSRSFAGQIVLISNYDDFSLVRQGMVLGAQDYLLKLTITTQEYQQMLLRMKALLDDSCRQRQQQSELQSEVDNAVRQQHQQQWRALLLTPRAVVHRSICQRIAETPVILLSIQILKYGDKEYSISGHDLELADCAVLNIVRELLEDTDSIVGNIEPSAYFAVTFLRAGSEVSAEFLAQKISSTLSRYLNVRVGIQYSEPLGSEQQLLEVLAALHGERDRFFYVQESTVCHILPQPEHLPWEPEQAAEAVSFCQFIGAADCAGATAQLAGMLQLCRQIEPDVTGLRSQWVSLLGRIYARLDGPGALRGLTIQPEDIYAVTSFDELQETLLSLPALLCAATGEGGRQVSSPEVKKLLQYIHANLHQKITLHELAEHVNFNESYMSTVFKNETGVSIINYINRLKMERAAQELQEDNRLLKEIALGLGFSDQFYFNKMFRKYYGLSPSAYRKNPKIVPTGTDFSI